MISMSKAEQFTSNEERTPIVRIICAGYGNNILLYWQIKTTRTRATPKMIGEELRFRETASYPTVTNCFGAFVAAAVRARYN